MSILTIVIGMLGTNICRSATASINSYIEKSNLPDVIYTTKLISTSKNEELTSIDGVKIINNRFVMSGNFEVEQDGIFSGNFISYDSKDLNTITYLEETEVDKNAIESYIPYAFAKRHNVEAGEKLILYVKGVKIETVIKAIISSPETLYGDKDFMSEHEAYSYTNLYVNKDDIYKTLHISNLSNQWLFYFEDGVSDSQKDQIKSQIEEVFTEENIVSYKDFEGMKNNLLFFKSNLDAVNKLGYFFAVLIVFITLGLNFVFIQIIIKKEKRTIALLKALGYKKKEIIFLFCVFTLLINIPAILLGFPLGYLMTKITLSSMKSSFFLPLNVLSISPITMCCLLLITLLIGVISSVLASSQISKIDPCDIYAKNEEFGREPAKFLNIFKGNAFNKISLTSMFRNLGRQIVGALCISACILFMFVSIEGYASNSKVRAGGYGDRFRYDFVIRSIDGEDYEDIKNNIDSIEIIEPYIFIDGTTDVGSKRIVAMKENNVLTTLHDKQNNVLLPGNGIIIDQFTANKNNLKVGDFIRVFNNEVQITGIAIEYIYAISYISFETAAQLGFSEINGAMIKLKDGSSSKAFTKEIFNLNSSIYVVKMADQQAYLYLRYTPISFALIILGTLSFLIGAVLVINTAMMDYLELEGKYATLRAIGTPMKKIIKISLFENIFRSIVGCLVALPICYFSALLLFKLLSSSYAYYAMTNFFMYFFASAGICIIYIIISVLISYFAIKKLDFAHYLNNRE